MGVNLARFLGFDAEIALKRANRKFAGRFREMERIAARRGQPLSGLSAAELDSLWNEVKGGMPRRGRGSRAARPEKRRQVVKNGFCTSIRVSLGLGELP